MIESPFPFNLNPKSQEEFFMAQALLMAWQAYNRREVPVGAVVVFQDKVIASARNRVEELSDATAHAERLAISYAASNLGNWRLTKCSLYTTVEPCFMCAGAAILSRLEKIFWAAPDPRHGAHTAQIDLFAFNHPIHNVKIIQGPYEEIAADLMRRFFRERRAEKRK